MRWNWLSLSVEYRADKVAQGAAEQLYRDLQQHGEVSLSSHPLLITIHACSAHDADLLIDADSHCCYARNKEKGGTLALHGALD